MPNLISSTMSAGLLRAASIAIAVGTALAGCPTPRSTPVLPTLPGDGTEHVAKPSEQGEPAKPPDPWTGRTDLIQPPPAPAPRAVELPPIDRFTLPNGLQVIVVQDHGLPIVSMQLVIKAGRAVEPLARLGVAELTADLLPKGTRRRNALALAKTIDFVGGAITADAGYEATWLTCSVLAKDAKVCLDLMPEMITQPTFPADEITKAKEADLATVLRRLDDAAQLAGVHVQNLLWGDQHSRGWATSPAWISRLTRADVVAWHKTWFVPNNAVLAVSGDVDPAKLRTALTRAFAGWRKRPIPARPPSIEPRLDGVKVRLVDKPGQTQTHIRVGQLGLRHDDPRFFPTLVWNYALGSGGFSSRLMQVVRSQGGKTYGAQSTFDRNEERGSFVAGTFTRTAETHATLELVLGELRKMHDQGPTADEVAAAIDNLAGGYAMRVASARDLAAALLTADLHGLSQTYVSSFPVVVGQVSRDEAARAAHEILTPGKFVVVLVGDGDAIAPQLDKAKIPYDRVRFDAPIGPQPVDDQPVDPGAAQRGVALLDAALAAKGGDKVTGLRTLRMTATGKLTAQGQTVPVEFERTLVVPDKMRMDITLASQFKIALAVSGAKGWQQGPGGVEDLPAEQLPQLALQRFIDPELVLTRHRDAGAKVAALAAEKIDGVPCDVVRVTSADGMTVTLYLDKKTHLLRQSRYGGPGVEQRDTFDDYQPVDGIAVARRRTSVGGGEKSELTVTKVEINPTVDPSVFVRPAT